MPAFVGCWGGLLPKGVEVVDGSVAVAYGVVGSGFDGGCDVVFGECGRAVEIVAVGEEGGECRRQRAACAVGVDSAAAARFEHEVLPAFGVVEHVD